MLKKLKVFTALFMLAGFVSTANAGLLLEPYLGYYAGKWEQGGGNEKFSGAGFGARVGYKHVLGPMFGLDYMTGKFEDKGDLKADLTPQQLGAFVGFEFPILLRVYAAYNFSDKLKFKSDYRSGTYEGDSGIKLGVGFTALPLLSINVEYVASSYDEFRGSATSPDFETKYYGLSVSLPFDL